MEELPHLQDKNKKREVKKRRIRKFPEVIIEPSGEKLDLIEFIEMILDFEDG